MEAPQTTVVLDGSLVPRFRQQYARRLKEIVELAIHCKQKGTGVLSRPEADPGLFQILATLHRLEPSAGWLDKALITYAWSLDDAMRRPDQVSWDLKEWWAGRLGESCSPHYLLREYVKLAESPDFETRDPEEIHWEIAARWARELDVPESLLPTWAEGCSEALEPSLAPVLGLLMRRRLTLARLYAQHSTWGAVVLTPAMDDPLPDCFPRPLWRNSTPAPWPKLARPRLKKLQWVVGRAVSNWGGQAEFLPEIVQPALGVLPPHPAWTSENYRPSMFLKNVIDQATLSLGELPVVERLMGGSAEALLASLLALSRVESERIHATNALTAFDDVFTALLVGDALHLRQWAKLIDNDDLPRSLKRACLAIKRWIENPDAVFKDESETAKSKFDKSLHQAVHGFVRRDAALINEAVIGMLASWPKTDFSIWDATFLPHLNIPAIAIQRTALRIGITPEIPNAPGNDRELVLAADPNEPKAPFMLLPGTELLGRDASLRWPSLLINEPVTAYAE